MDMKKIIKRITIVAMVIIVAMVAYFLFFMRAIHMGYGTYFTTEKICFAIAETLGTKPLDEYNLASEVIRLFPRVPVKNDQIVNVFGNPMMITLEREADGFRLTSYSTRRGELLVYMLRGKVTSEKPDAETIKKMRGSLRNRLETDKNPDILQTFEEGVVWYDSLVLGTHGSLSTNEFSNKEYKDFINRQNISNPTTEFETTKQPIPFNKENAAP